MEAQYYLMKALLYFIVLFFGFILFLYSEFLRLHDEAKLFRIIIGILGVAFILFFIFQSGLVKYSWEEVFKWHRTIDYVELHKDYTFSQDISIWKKSVSKYPFWLLTICFLMFLALTAGCLYVIFEAFFLRGALDQDSLRDNLKKLSIFNVHDLVLFAFGCAFSLVIGIYSLFQLGSFTMAIGYRLFY